MSDLIGQTIGNYHIEALLGSGGMGQVFRARHIHLDRRAAVKVMHEHLARDPSFQARFRQEARVIAALQHPNIVEVYDFGEQNGRFYLVLELLTDGSLRTLLHRRAQNKQAWPLTFGLNLMQQAAASLAYAHSQNMVHRDVKPDNMLLKRPTNTSDPLQLQLKLTDFGLVRLAEGSVMTATGTAMGTPAYMSPEQCQGSDVDGRSDIYSLGVVIYEVATGVLPFTARTISEAAYKHVNVAPPSPRQFAADLPTEVEALILRCLNKRPDDRFATAGELEMAIKHLLKQPSSALTTPTVLATAPATPQVTPQALSQQRTVADSGPAPDLPSTLPKPPIAGLLPQLQVLDQQRQVVQVREIGGDGLTVGRLSSNDLALDGEGVSRHHLRLDWDGQRVTVTDVGSSNGTFLGEHRLQPQVPETWPWRTTLRIGDYWLRAEAPAQMTIAEMTAAANQQRFATPTTTPVPSTTDLMLTCDKEQITLVPGQTSNLLVRLTNLGRTVEHISLTVEGVPAEWVRNAPSDFQLMPNGQETINLLISPPRSFASRAGEHLVTLHAQSRQNPALRQQALVRWQVQPFFEHELALTPRRVAARTTGDYTVKLTNQGNTAVSYQPKAEDDEQALNYQFSPAKVMLEPGTSANLALQVSAPRRWLGSPQNRPFRVTAPTAEVTPAPLHGELVHQALIPNWLPPLTIALVLMICLGLYSLLVRPPAFADTITFAPPSPVAGEAVTVRWNVSGANSITIQPEGQPAISNLNPNDGEYTFPNGFPAGTTVKVVATNSFGSTEKTVTIGVVAQAQTPTPTSGPAQIVAFRVTPAQIKTGEAVQLSWEVAEAVSVEIEQFGTVDLKGQREDRPRLDTSYRLIVVGKDGKTVSRVEKVTVINADATAQLLASQTAIVQATMIAAEQAAASATVVAQQTAAAQQTADANNQAAANATATAVAQQTAVAEAATATFVAGATQTAIVGATQTAVAIAESGIDLYAEAPNAVWSSAAGKLPFGGSDGDSRGFVLHRAKDALLLENDSSPQMLETHPQWLDNGYIRGEYEVKRIADGQHFLATVGFIKPQGSPATNGVTIRVSFQGNVIYQGLKTYDGKLMGIGVDMSGYAGQSGKLVLEVGANGNSAQDWLCWINPRIGFPRRIIDPVIRFTPLPIAPKP